MPKKLVNITQTGVALVHLTMYIDGVFNSKQFQRIFLRGGLFADKSKQKVSFEIPNALNPEVSF